MEYYLSAASAASLVGVHPRTIENWASQGYLEREKGKYGLISALKYRIEQLESKNSDLKSNPPKEELLLQKLQQEVLERTAIARIKTMEADVMEGQLVNTGEVVETWKGAIAKTKAKFIALPAKLALELSGMDRPEDIQARLAQVIDEALIEMGAGD
ncbi:MAG TPA: hypothetical protein V6C71_09965 [Coleofasciculaceae cyanobacterium]|jgi:phage terminase Nu1 subunit (DNA packaging protein)